MYSKDFFKEEKYSITSMIQKTINIKWLVKHAIVYTEHFSENLRRFSIIHKSSKIFRKMFEDLWMNIIFFLHDIKFLTLISCKKKICARSNSSKKLLLWGMIGPNIIFNISISISIKFRWRFFFVAYYLKTNYMQWFVFK